MDLFFSPRSPQSHSSLELWAYPDVDWARDPTDNRSITTYYFLEWTSLISWYSKKLFIVARYSIEFKYKVLTLYQVLLLLHWLLENMGAP